MPFPCSPLDCPSLLRPLAVCRRARRRPARRLRRWAVEPFVLKDIRVEGLQRTDAGTVFASLPFRIGDTYNDEKGAAALRALFATGLFKDVRIDIDGDVRRRHRRRAPGHRQHRLRRPEGVRQGRADQVAERLRHRRRPAVRQGAGRPRRAGTQAPVPDAQPLRRRGRDHGHAASSATASTSPSRSPKATPAQDQRDPHRRQQGLLRRHAEGPVRPERRRLAQLVHQVRPLLARQAQRRPRDAARLLPEPRLPRVRRRVDAGRDLARQAGHLRSPINVNEGQPYTVTGVKLEGDYLGKEDEFKSLVTIKPGEPYRAETVAETTKRVHRPLRHLRLRVRQGRSRGPRSTAPTARSCVTLVAEPQRRVYVRRINVAGNTRTRDEVDPARVPPVRSRPGTTAARSSCRATGSTASATSTKSTSTPTRCRARPTRST